MSKQRITIETLAAGQPGPYADHKLHVRVTFELSYKTTGEWEPWNIWDDAEVRALLKTAKCGFTDDPPADWASPKLERLWKSAPGVWEFIITEAYTG